MKTSTLFALWAVIFIGLSAPAFAQSPGPLDAEELKFKKTYRSLDRALAEPEQVFKLSLIEQDLKALPAEIGKLKNLQILYLNSNKLKELPEELGNCKNLQVINLYKNKLTEIPPFLGKFKHLEEIYLGHNKIVTAPIWIGQLRHVKLMDMTSNPLYFSEIAYLKKQLPTTAMSF
ncbi:MAG: leucine-rich repeat domain-containing protein [Bacteroidia bacterium]|nr:leucine-rich repeat domain-containing protein [Bacteroidia bacterium]